jgi:hypothetical protein
LQNDPQECCNLFNVPEVAAVVRELTVRLIQRMMCYGQPPEHLPVPVMQGIGEDGLPVWDTRTVRIMDCAGMTPGLSI